MNFEDFYTVADLLAATGVYGAPVGITKVTGICADRPNLKGSTQADTAFEIGKDTPVTVPTKKLFQQNLPYNFAILMTIKPELNYNGNVFSVYDESGFAKLAVQVTNDAHVSLFYNDGSVKAGEEVVNPTFDFNATDGR